MLNQIISEINSKKNSNQPFYILLEKLESILNSLSIYESSQAALFLAIDFFSLEIYEKAEFYSDMCQNLIHDCFQKNILDYNDVRIFAHNLSKVHIVKIDLLLQRNPNSVNNLTDYISNLKNSLDFNLMINNSSIFIDYVLQKINENEKYYDLIKIISYFISKKEDFTKIINIYFGFNKKNSELEEYLLKEKRIFSGYEDYFFIFMRFDFEMIKRISNNIVFKKNNLEDLSIIILNSCKTQNYKAVEYIFAEIDRMIDVNNESFLFYKCLYAKLTGNYKENIKIDFSSKNKMNKIESYIKEDYVAFLLKRNSFEEILRLKPKRDIEFYCLVQLNKLDLAEKIYEEELNLKYNINEDIIETSNIDDMILKRHLFIYFLRKRDNSSALNILQKLTNPDDFSSCLKICYEENRIDVLKECIFIGIKKFCPENISLLKILISYLHIQEINIGIDQKVNIIVKTMKNMKFDEYASTDREWFYNVAYNNSIDTLLENNPLFWNLIEICIDIKHQIDISLIEIILNGYLKNIKNENSKVKDLFSIETLLEKYIESKTYTFDITLLFYELCNSEKILELFQPVSKMSNTKIKRLLTINNSNHLFRQKIFKMCVNKKLIDEETCEKVLLEIAAYGPLVLLEFTENLENYEWISKNIEIIFQKQIEFLKLINSVSLEIRFRKILKNVNKTL